MKKNQSPWLYQLRKERPTEFLSKDVRADVAIIGAGIAGIATAFFTLRDTEKSVIMVERHKLAHGATGHNAGQVVSYFERGLKSLTEEFGLMMAAEGQKNIIDAWLLLDEMYLQAKLTIPFSRFMGHAGLVSFEQVLLHLTNNALKRQSGLATEEILISDVADFLDDIPKEFVNLYALAPQEKILKLLETKDTSYICVLSSQKGCINSALFCEEILLYLLETYKGRFTLYEHTPITKLVLHSDMAYLDAGTHFVESDRVVLCTNGFENVTILNETGLDINTKFHHLVDGNVGYMSGYLEEMNKPPIAISYLTNPEAETSDPYFYLTRREYEYEDEKRYNLISIGGPEMLVNDSRAYTHESDFPSEKTKEIDEFLKKTYTGNIKVPYVFTWHGLMGYTKNGVRLIGVEPKNPVLLYNLGCNGVGILPSLYGGKKISEVLSGLKHSPSIWDVPKEYDQTKHHEI